MPKIMPHIAWAILLFAVALAGGCFPFARSVQSLMRRDLVLVSEQPAHAHFGHRMRVLLRGGRFDRLEVIADSLERHDLRWDSGRALITTFYEQGFATVDSPERAELWEAHLSRLRQWVEVRPNSAIARFALVEALIGRAWAARGHGWANTVSEDRWQRFAQDLDEAGQRLEQCPRPIQATYEWHAAMMRTLHGIGPEGDSLYRLVAWDALERFPAEPRFYTGVAGHLMPRWYGELGDWQVFADTITVALPDSLADEFYARIVLAQAGMVQDVFRDGGPVDWARVRRGLDRWERRWPAASQPRSALALLASMKGDRGAARASFAALKDTCDLEVWGSLPRYWAARQRLEKRGG